MAQFKVENSVSLHRCEAEPLHHDRFRLILVSNNRNHLINIEVGDNQTIKNMQAINHLLQTMLKATANDLCTPSEPLSQYLTQVFHLRTTINTDHIEVNAVAALKISGGKQVRHQLLNIDTVRAGHDDEASWIFVIRLIA